MASDGELRDSIEKSRETFRRSAEQAAPSVERRSEAHPPLNDVAADLHPFFRGLLETLPEPGSDWSSKEREQWLETARNIFALIYKERGDEREQTTAAPPVRLVEPQPHATQSETQHEARPETQLDQRTA